MFYATFNNCSLYHFGQFNGAGNRTPGDTADLSHVTDKLYHIMLNRIHLAMSEIRTYNFNGDCH